MVKKGSLLSLVCELNARKESQNSWHLAVNPRTLNASTYIFLLCQFKLERKTRVVRLLKTMLSVGFKLRTPECSVYTSRRHSIPIPQLLYGVRSASRKLLVLSALRSTSRVSKARAQSCLLYETAIDHSCLGQDLLSRTIIGRRGAHGANTSPFPPTGKEQLEIAQNTWTSTL
jgi:hypothetical protein